MEPDKVQKLMPNASAAFNVVFTTRKNAKFGKQRYAVPVDVKGGPSYMVEFCANLTIPELAMSSENLDFGRFAPRLEKPSKSDLRIRKRCHVTGYISISQMSQLLQMLPKRERGFRCTLRVERCFQVSDRPLT